MGMTGEREVCGECVKQEEEGSSGDRGVWLGISVPCLFVGA